MSCRSATRLWLPAASLSAAVLLVRRVKTSACNAGDAWLAALPFAWLLPFSLDRCIGDGGTSYVWEAHRRGGEPNAGKVALKLKYRNFEMRDNDEVGWCRRAHLLSRLAPQYHLDCYEAGRIRNRFSDIAWWALELARGQSVATLIEWRAMGQPPPPQLASLRGAIGLALQIFDAMEATLPVAPSSSLQKASLRFFPLDIRTGNVMLDLEDGAISFVDLDEAFGCWDTSGEEAVPGEEFPSCASIAPTEFCTWYTRLELELFRTFLYILTIQPGIPVQFYDLFGCEPAHQLSEICQWVWRIWYERLSSPSWCNGTLAAAAPGAAPPEAAKVLLRAEEPDPSTPAVIQAVERLLPEGYREDWRRALPLGLEAAFASAQSLAWPPLYVGDLRRAWAGLAA